MILTDFSVRRPVFTVMVVMVILLLGAVSFSRLTIDLFPRVSFPVAIAVTEYPGVGPQEVENLVTRPIEEIMGTVNNVKLISSESREETSVVAVEFNWGTDMDFATLQMREKIDLVQPFLPEDVKKPLVFKMDPALLPIITIGLSGGRDLAELRELAEDHIKSRLERLDGVASVYVSGGLVREILVEPDPVKLKAYGVSIGQLVAALAAENVNVPGGKVEQAKKNLVVRATGEFKSVRDIEDVLVAVPGAGPLKLSQLAAVTDGFRERTQYTRMNGRPSVGIAVQKQTNANTVRVASLVKKEMAKLRSELPEGVEYSVALDQSEFIIRSVMSVVRNAALGGVFSVLILLLFLGNMRSTLVIALSIPICIIATFVLLYFAGLTLNMMSLGGLALGIGILVDSAIVVLESIFRHRSAGSDRIRAASEGTAEVANAVTASTLTTLVVFLPIVFVQGIASQFFSQLALTVSFSLAAALVVSLTLTPMLASRLVEAGKGTGIVGRIAAGFDRWVRGLEGAYAGALRWALAHRRVVLGGAILAFLGSFLLLPFIGMELIPRMDSGEFEVTVKLPNGTALAETDRVVRTIEEIVRDIPEVNTVFATVGATTSVIMGGQAGSDRGDVDVRLVPINARNRSLTEVVEEVRARVSAIPGADVTVTPSSGYLGSDWAGPPVNIAVKGDDLDVLSRIAREVAFIAREVPGTRQVDYSLAEGQPELRLEVNRERAASYGLSFAQVASTVRAAVSGQVATRYKVAGDEIDVRVRYPAGARRNVEDLRNLILQSPTGKAVPLYEVAELTMAKGPVAIEREGQARLVRVTGQLVGRDLGSVIRDIKARAKSIELPPGYSIEYSGENREMVEAFGNLGFAFVLAIFLVYMIMAAQFESLLYPLVIMFSVPLAVIGVIVGLAVTGRTLNMPGFIGIIMLAGIVVNNAIVLVDYINTLRARGHRRDEAIVLAGRTRLRPILMTALTTILAMLPLGLGIGEGAEAQAPLATAVIGGLSCSTVLTLIVVPSVYTLFDDVGARLGFIKRSGRS